MEVVEGDPGPDYWHYRPDGSIAYNLRGRLLAIGPWRCAGCRRSFGEQRPDDRCPSCLSCVFGRSVEPIEAAGPVVPHPADGRPGRVVGRRGSTLFLRWGHDERTAVEPGPRAV